MWLMDILVEIATQANLAIIMSCLWVGLFVVLLILVFVNLFIKESQLPDVFKAAIRHGKLMEKQFLAVPKKFFTHFYLVGLIINTAAAILLLLSLGRGTDKIPYIGFLVSQLHFGSGAIDRQTALLLVILMALQNARRLFESLFVTVFSPSKMSFFHYLIGHLMYCTFHLSVISQTDFTSQGLRNDRYYRLCGITLFFIGSYVQHKTSQQLANLRKSDDEDAYKASSHHIPRGGLFDFVSCPHYFSEILIFTSFLIITHFQHAVLWTVVLFVILNQLVSGHLTHKWYLHKFDEYKKLRRRAVIPFVF